MKEHKKFDWLDIIEYPFRQYAKMSKQQQNRILIELWMISVFSMILAGVFSLLLG